MRETLRGVVCADKILPDTDPDHVLHEAEQQNISPCSVEGQDAPSTPPTIDRENTTIPRSLSFSLAEYEECLTPNDTLVVPDNNESSLDGSDLRFSQEIREEALNLGEICSSSDSTDNELSPEDCVIQDEELVRLHPGRSFTEHNFGSDNLASSQTICEDLWSGIHYNYEDEALEVPFVELPEEEGESRVEHASEQEAQVPKEACQEGDLPDWQYESPFAPVRVVIDDVDDSLEGRFVLEANTVLKNVATEILSRRADVEQNESSDVETEDFPSMNRLECLQTFLPKSLLERLANVANRSLRQRKQEKTTAEELQGLIILHVLCASYDETPTVVCHPDGESFFFQMGISAERYKHVWSALNGNTGRRDAVEYSATGWSRTSDRSTSLITDIENEVASVNRNLVYVRGVTIKSLDDDHLRMASRSVCQLTSLQQYNNPKKGLGPVGNALCSALNPFFICCHFTRSGERLLDTWQRLVLMLQGVATVGAVGMMVDSDLRRTEDIIPRRLSLSFLA